MRRTFSGDIASVCDASTSRTCDVPMPNAIAPNAPCVDVWLSPQQIVIPGCVSPSSGPMTCTMPCAPLGEIEQRNAVRAAIPLERRRHRLGHRVGERPHLRPRRHDVIDGRERPLGRAHRPAARVQFVERLRARDFVDEMQADVQLRLPVRQRPHGVQIPHFLKQRSAHRSLRSYQACRAALAPRAKAGLIGMIRAWVAYTRPRAQGHGTA